MHPELTPSQPADHIQYATRRERREAEGYVREDLTRRQARRIERANEYLSLQQSTLDMYQTAHTEHPEARLFSTIDAEGNLITESEHAAPPVELTGDLDLQGKIIDFYRAHVEERHWREINQLDQKWHEMQPKEEVIPESVARSSKIGSYVARLMNASRQHWMNQKTTLLKVGQNAETRSEEFRKAA